jgi:hypothetical protein
MSTAPALDPRRVAGCERLAIVLLHQVPRRKLRVARRHRQARRDATRAEQALGVGERHRLVRAVFAPCAIELPRHERHAPRLGRPARVADSAPPPHTRRWEGAGFLVVALAALARAARLNQLARRAPQLRDTRLHHGVGLGRVGEDQSHGGPLRHLHSRTTSLKYPPVPHRELRARSLCGTRASNPF